MELKVTDGMWERLMMGALVVLLIVMSLMVIEQKRAYFNICGEFCNMTGTELWSSDGFSCKCHIVVEMYGADMDDIPEFMRPGKKEDGGLFNFSELRPVGELNNTEEESDG